jgi:hypothetical protein
MKIEIAKGFAEMADTLSRKAARIFHNSLFENATIDEKGAVLANPQQVDRAGQDLTLALIKRVIVVGADGQEAEMQPTPEWYDSLDNVDAKKLENEAYRIKTASDELVKKL